MGERRMCTFSRLIRGDMIAGGAVRLAVAKVFEYHSSTSAVGSIVNFM